MVRSQKPAGQMVIFFGSGLTMKTTISDASVLGHTFPLPVGSERSYPRGALLVLGRDVAAQSPRVSEISVLSSGSLYCSRTCDVSY